MVENLRNRLFHLKKLIDERGLHVFTCSIALQFNHYDDAKKLLLQHNGAAEDYIKVMKSLVLDIRSVDPQMECPELRDADECVKAWEEDIERARVQEASGAAMQVGEACRPT